MHFTTTLFAALLSLASSTTANRAMSHSWHVSNLDAGCQNGRCYYIFDVSSHEYDDIPKFTARCTARTLRRDSTYRPCTLQQQPSGPRKVEKVEAFLSLTPRIPQDTVLSIMAQVNNGNGVVTRWYGNVTAQPYQYYVDNERFNVIPQSGASVA